LIDQEDAANTKFFTKNIPATTKEKIIKPEIFFISLENIKKRIF